MKTPPLIFRLIVGAVTTLLISNCVAAEETSLFPVSVEGKWGYIDDTGRLVVKPRFLDAQFFSEGLARVEVAGTTEEDHALDRTYEGFIDPKGKFVIPPQPPKGIRETEEYRKNHCYSFSDFHDGRARFLIGDTTGVYGFINRKGEVIIEPKFYDANDFSEGVAFVSSRVNPYMESSVSEDALSRQRTGFINTNGEFVLTLDFVSFSYDFVEQRASVTVCWGEYGDPALIDRQGNIVVPPGIYTSLGSPVAGAIRAVKDGEVGLLDCEGKIIVEFGKYEQITEPEEGSIFVAETSDSTFLLDSAGKQLAEVAEEGDVGRFWNDLATIKRDGQFGYIDADGKLTIPIKFDYAKSFKDGLALFRQGETLGYIDRRGVVVWKTERWHEPVRNSVRKPLSTLLPQKTIETLPLSYNEPGSDNALVFVANGNLNEIRAWYRKHGTDDSPVFDHTDPESKPDRIELHMTSPSIEVYAVDGTGDIADAFVEFYGCENMSRLRKKYPKKVVGVLFED